MEINNNIIKQNLEFQRTIEYFLEHVNGGGILGKTINEKINFKIGNFFSFLPTTSPLNRVYEFSSGGINPSISSNEIHHTQGDLKFIPEKRITTFLEVGKYIKQYLEEKQNRIAIFEDVIQSREDPPSAILNAKLHFYGNQVYYSLSKSNSLEEIYFLLKCTDCTWHSLIVLAHDVKLSNNLTMRDIFEIVKFTECIITSAHDSENCIIWEKSNSLSFDE